MRYRSRPESVEAFQFTGDADRIGPDWFADMLEKQEAIIDSVLIDGAVVITGCTIYRKNARLYVRTGDYIVRRNDGQISVERPKAFAERFKQEEKHGN